jgi:propanediol dehydratase small subunit
MDRFMTVAMTAIFVVIIVASFVGYYTRWGIPAPYRTRACQGLAWRREFPAASNEQIREFLSLLVGAFGFHDRFKLKFGPSDQLLDLYRALYPRKNMPDGMELEAFASSIAKKYGVDLAGAWRDNLTIGQVFAMVTEKR